MRQKYQHVYCSIDIWWVYAYFFCCSVNARHFTLYNGTFPVWPQQRTGACKCHVIVVVWRQRVQKLTPAELRLFANQSGFTVNVIIVDQMIVSIELYRNLTLSTDGWTWWNHDTPPPFNVVTKAAKEYNKIWMHIEWLLTTNLATWFTLESITWCSCNQTSINSW